jgi:hypothetical protein
MSAPFHIVAAKTAAAYPPYGFFRYFDAEGSTLVPTNRDKSPDFFCPKTEHVLGLRQDAT